MSNNNFLILISEDDDADMLLLESALHREGFENPIERARNGQRAIDYLSAALAGTVELPSLVILDLQTPRRHGFEVLEWIRSKPQLETLPVAIITGLDTPEDRARAAEFEFVSFFLKNSFLPGLAELIHSLGARLIYS